jgi:hypothetical protein
MAGSSFYLTWIDCNDDTHERKGNPCGSNKVVRAYVPELKGLILLPAGLRSADHFGGQTRIIASLAVDRAFKIRAQNIGRVGDL